MAGHFQRFMAACRARDALVVQPRMGFGPTEDMRAGLAAVAQLGGAVIGTITLDSYTRVGDYRSPLDCLARGEKLNGYPILSHSREATRALLDGLEGPGFPIQVRHGTAKPQAVFRRMIDLRLDASEGGPISYCMPYSQVPLADAVAAWAEGCRLLAGETAHGHLESFGGCLLGQLCPPSLLVAISVLETLFFRQHGLTSLSLSYAQGTSAAQDRGAIGALRRLATEYLGDVDWHVVVYTYMGVFPATEAGARRLIADSARLARDAGGERLIVKTTAESRQIPTIEDNLAALTLASVAAREPPAPPSKAALGFGDEIYQEAKILLDCVLDLDRDIGTALIAAFRRGLLDIPFCLHRDNSGRTATCIDGEGALRWASVGDLPLPQPMSGSRRRRVSAGELLQILGYVARRYDHAAAA